MLAQAKKPLFKAMRPAGKVGKRIGDNLYIHKSAIERLPASSQFLIKQTKSQLPDDFNYEILKINTKEETVSFIDSPDWNESPEPFVGDSIKVSLEHGTTFTKGRSNNKQIYHHKWMFVEDSYTGFDVEEAKARSEEWENADISFDRKKIGNSDYWYETVVPEFEVNEIRVDLTSLKQVAAVFKNDNFQIGPVNLDIGGGKYNLGTEYLKEKGITNYIYDTYSRDYGYNQRVLNELKGKCIDTVTVANVLNVVRSEEERKGIIAQAAAMVDDFGICYFQIFEGDRSGIENVTSKRTWQANRKTAEYISELSPFFFSIERKGNVLICMHPNKEVCKELIRKQSRQWTLQNNVFVVEKYLEIQ